MRIGLLGYGTVAAPHAAQLREAGAALEVVYGPDPEKARRFAGEHGFAAGTSDLPEALAACDAAVIASPSPVHCSQALEALRMGRHVLVELPPCATPEEAGILEEAARASGKVLQCAHTSRYLPAYREAGEWIRSGRAGDILQVVYHRGVRLAPRTWRDDALWHHGAHPVDLLLHWLGGFEPLACVCRPSGAETSDVALLARLPGGGTASLAISYSGRPSASRMVIVGSRQTLATDGFTLIEIDGEPVWRHEARPAFHRAVFEQDRSFLDGCRAGAAGLPWGETRRMCSVLAAARRLSP